MKGKAIRQFSSSYGSPANASDWKESKGKVLHESSYGCGIMANPLDMREFANNNVSQFKDSPLIKKSNVKFKAKEADTNSHARKRMKESLRLFRDIFCTLDQENKKLAVRKPNIHQKAVVALQNSCNWHPVEKRVGSIDGVQIGDEFQSRAELYIAGVHCQFQNGIDFVNKDGTKLATSIVVTHRYKNTRNGDVLIYSGEGGNPNIRNCRPLKDQEMTKGNLALWNSMKQHSPVRVIYRINYAIFCSRGIPSDIIFIYDGLYMVEKYEELRGKHRKRVFNFQLRRISGQTRPTQGFLSKGNDELLCDESLIIQDISKDREKVPIAVVNTLDGEKPFPFKYIANRICSLVPHHRTLNSCDGCDCIDGCSDSEDCSCKIKNGRAFAYDYSEHIVAKRGCIYECGVLCKCYESCINRVSQRKIRVQLEVFKADSKGWGVRSKVHIPAGSFICEYVGEVVKVNEAKERIGLNDYLFDINCNEEGEFFTIDASRLGNVGRFINHSCSPNLCVQSVIYGDYDCNLSHMMLFAMKDIPRLQELTYDYKYKIGESRSNNGDFNVKKCNCQSTNCLGKFYE